MTSPARTTAKAAVRTAGVSFGTYVVLIAQALLARRRIGTTTDRPPSGNGVYGHELDGDPIRCLLLGDSTMVGYGMKTVDHTPSALVGIGLSHVLGVPVQIHNESLVGARSSDLQSQIDAAVGLKPQLTIILVGANDITHQVPAKRSARRLGAAVRRLRAMGSEVIVGSVPDFGTIKPLPVPLRTVCRYWSRHLARRQTVAAVEAGARVVSLSDVLEPLLLLKGDALFGDDRFHPSAHGYATVANFLVDAAVTQWRSSAVRPLEAEPIEQMTLEDAAEWAVEHGGTQVAPAPRGRRWAAVLRWRR
ncbi:SGNH/GDSL hydrolase family protein [Aeromicrobium duanguangcaii]|uniref:SGNH/GDSL hydrolase family protein n=1 Tax=Aeromicrobium duanguangcaii TaxID=2968086 RepID=UPI0020177065|nr:SGNH/GDSL hydrolase family protein [Aeromicrobium duanguangcaii]